MTDKTFLSHNKDFHEKMEKMADNGEQNPWCTENLRDVFILGMCYGIKKGIEPSEIEEGKKKYSIRIAEVIRENHMLLFRAAAFYHTKDYHVLFDDKKIYEIAEKFSNSGTASLIDDLSGKENPSFDLAKFILGDADDQTE